MRGYESINGALSNLTNEQLLERCVQAKGDGCIQEAMAELVDRLHGGLVRYLGFKLGDHQLAEDVAQETLIRLYRYAGRFDRSRASVRTWLYHIGTNLARNAMRDRKRRSALSLTSTAEDENMLAERLASGVVGPLKEVERRELCARVRAAIDQLPDHHRDVVLLCDIEGLSYEQIASVLELKIGTVRSRLFRARAQLYVIMTEGQPSNQAWVDNDGD